MNGFDRPWRVSACVAALLALHAGLLLGELRRTFITKDEPGHVLSGLSYWRTGRFLVYRVNPPLPKLLAVLPLLAVDPRVDFEGMAEVPGRRVEFRYWHEFTEANRDRLFDLVCLARLMGVAWSVAGGWVVFSWSRDLFGVPGGFLSLTLWCFDPLVLGHAILVTPDVPSAVAGMSAAFAFWRFLSAPGWGRAFAAGGLLGVAVLTKFTLLLFFGLWPVLWAIARRSAPGARPRRGLGSELLLLLSIAGIGLYVIDLGYLFQGTFQPLGDYAFASKALSGRPDDRPSAGGDVVPGNRFRGTLPGRIPVPLPRDLVLGIDAQKVDFESHLWSYLAGRWRRQGWWYYYLYALAVKLPIGTLVLMLAGASATFTPGNSPRRRLAGVVLLASASAILAFVSLQTGFSHHLRYALPALPFLMINCGQLVREPGVPGRPSRRLATALVPALAMAVVASSLSVYPASLSYFNELAGGPSGGPAHLLDSNIDWGQDLLNLKRWLAAHPEARPLGLAYYGGIDPRSVGIEFELPPPDPGCVKCRRAGREAGPCLRPGYYALSVNFLRGFESAVPDGRGGMRDAHLGDYRYFQGFRPIDRAGYSISIYKVTAGQAERWERRSTAAR